MDPVHLQVRPTEALSSHHYLCCCTKELWVLLMHLLEHRNKVLHTQVTHIHTCSLELQRLVQIFLMLDVLSILFLFIFYCFSRQKFQTFSGSSFFNARICCFSLPFMIVNRYTLDYGFFSKFVDIL